MIVLTGRQTPILDQLSSRDGLTHRHRTTTWIFISPSSPTFSEIVFFTIFFSPLGTLFLVGLPARLAAKSSPLVVDELMADPGRLVVGIREGGGGMLKLDEEGARTSEAGGPERALVDAGGFLDIVAIACEVYESV